MHCFIGRVVVDPYRESSSPERWDAMISLSPKMALPAT
jgi:hypothetical protein